MQNPIGIGTGDKFLVEADYSARSSGGLELTRHYRNSVYMSRARMGAQWRHTYDRKISTVGTAGVNFATVTREDGRAFSYLLTNGIWVADGDITDTLIQLTDGSGAIAGWQLKTANGELETYAANGALSRIQSPTGSVRTLTYDAQGLLSTVTDSFGQTLTFAYDGQGRVSQITDLSGRVTQYAYDAANNLVSVTYPDGRSKQYVYGESSYTSGASLPNALTGVVDENGTRYITYSYDSAGRATAEVLAGIVGGTTLSFGTNSTTVTDALNTARTYNFQTIQGVVKSTGVSQPGGAGCGAASSALSYDANGNVASRTDFNGVATTYSYDLTRNLETQRIEASGKAEQRTISTQWHSVWRLPVKVAEPKKLSTLTYNGDGGVYCAPTSATVPNGTGSQPIGVLCKKTEQATNDATGSQGLGVTPVGTARTWSWTYNQYGQTLTADGPRTDVADITTTTYYPITDSDPGKRGNLATLTNARGHVTQITAYDLNGNPLTVIDPNGVVSTLTYDARQRLTSRSIASETTRYQYDPVGQLTQITLPDGSTVRYTYDAAHRLTAIADALGNRIDYTLDAIGNRTKEEVRDPANQLSRTRRHIYDALSRLQQDISAQNYITAYEYDANGNRTKVTDPLNQATVSAYDSLNRLIAITDPNAGRTGYTYNGQDRITQITDPRNLATTYTLDGLGNRQQQTSPDTGSTTSTFDAAGNELTRTDAKGQITSTQYDALNRPVLVTYQDGSQVRSTWDMGSNGIGRLTKLEELSNNLVTGSLQYAYDAQGRIVTETRSIGTLTGTTGYTWSGGKLSGMTLPSGKQMSYVRDSAGQITQASLTNNGQTKVLASTITYHPFGGIKSWTDGAGKVHNRSQDQDGRATTYNLGSTTWMLSYDPAGRITGQMDAGNAQTSGAYTYDALDRLTQANLPSVAYGYGYDATGNRTSQTIGGTTRAYVTDTASNRLRSVASTPPKTYSFDANGSVTGDGSNQYAYDAKGRLAQTTTTAGTTQYRINALGQRVRKSNGTTDTLYHYDINGHLLAESDAQGNIQREYIWLDDVPLAVLQ